MKPQGQVYRVPPVPPYLGGYYWPPVAWSASGLVVASIAATQWLARHFAYQAALGQPIVRLAGIPWYQPFAWLFWLWRFGASTDERIREPFFGAAMAILGIVFVCGGFARWAGIHRARRWMNQAEDLYGTARLATENDIRETGLLDTRCGVYVGGWLDSNHGRLHYLKHGGPEHVLAFAPTRSGKGVSLVLPTLLAWEESAVIYDIKGENWAKTAGYRHASGQVCLKFSPVEDGTSSRFNPLAELRLFQPRDVSDAQNMADMIVRTGEDSPSERYWQEAAASITVGILLHVCYAAAAEKRIASLADLAGIFTVPGTSFRDTLGKIMTATHDPDGVAGWKLPDGSTTQTHPVVREKVQEMLDKAEKDFSGVLSTAKTALTIFSDPLVAANTSASDFSVQDLVNNERPVSLYLVVPPSDKIRLRPLIRLIFTTIVNRLTEHMDFQDSERIHNRHRLLFLIDEFPSLKRMELFADALSYMAGYGCKAYLIAQDICQIVDEYGTNQSLVSNCHIRVAFAPNNYETAELLSRMAGRRTIQKASVNFSGPRRRLSLDHIAVHQENLERPLLTPDEILRLQPARKQIVGDQERIVEAGDMLIFVSGHHPIYGKQMLYFQDPVLSERAKIFPPTRFFAIQKDGSLRLQPPLARTQNRMSSAEPTPPLVERSTGGENAFWVE